MDARLRKAVSNNELCIYYQPLVDIGSGLIVGAEALVRWQDEQEGLIQPDRFIPIAEETGLIREIGKWVLRDVITSYSIHYTKLYDPVADKIMVSTALVLIVEHYNTILVTIPALTMIVITSYSIHYTKLYDQVSLVGFGTFTVRERASRTGRNPQTGETLEIAAAKLPAFKAGKALKEAVN